MEPLFSAPPPVPGKVIKLGSQAARNASTVLLLQQRLNALGCGPLEENGVFDRETLAAVKLFQARFADSDGLPLKIDGEVGPLTWAALFGAQSVPVHNEASSPLLSAVIDFAGTQVGVREAPPGSNRGPQVDKYLRSVGLDPNAGSFAWCVAFLFFCFEQAAKKLERGNPMIKTAGVLDHWNKAGAKGVPRVTAARAAGNPALVKPGQIFVIDTGGGHGHSGLVERVLGGKLVTVEGNSNEGGSREGIGVFRRSQRKIVSINKGFVDYGTS